MSLSAIAAARFARRGVPKRSKRPAGCCAGRGVMF
jgi:hypothetical protein